MPYPPVGRKAKALIGQRLVDRTMSLKTVVRKPIQPKPSEIEC